MATLNDEIMGFMLDNARKRNSIKSKDPPVKAEISPEEALIIFNELVKVFQKHNVSYQCACRLCMALTHSFMTGAAELYRIEQNKP